MTLAWSIKDAPARAPTLSVVIPVTQRTRGLARVLDLYRPFLDTLNEDYEILYVISHFDPDEANTLHGTPQVPLRVIRVPEHFREASCVREGAKRALGDRVLVLPPYLQVAPTSIPAIVKALGANDLIVTSRDRSRESFRNRVRGKAFRTLSRMASSRFDDLGCLVLIGRREVFEELTIEDSQYNFLPIMAERVGFSVQQVVVTQAESDLHYRSHGLPAYTGRLLDLLSISFLIQFLQKPFRFFGTLGAAIMAVGLAIGFLLLFQRSAANMPMADRPALLLSVLLVVLGIQIGAVGLIAEVVLFTRLPANANYRIREIIERSDEKRAPADG
jgi:hypothetical protein